MKHTTLLVISAVCVLVLGLSSCTKQLDEVVPQDAISKDQALKDPNAARTLYHGVYGRFRAYNSTFFQLGEMRSEIWVDGETGLVVSMTNLKVQTVTLSVFVERFNKQDRYDLTRNPKR